MGPRDRAVHLALTTISGMATAAAGHVAAAQADARRAIDAYDVLGASRESAAVDAWLAALDK